MHRALGGCGRYDRVVNLFSNQASRKMTREITLVFRFPFGRVLARELVRIRSGDQPDHMPDAVVAPDELIGQGLEQFRMTWLKRPWTRRRVTRVDAHHVPAIDRIHDPVAEKMRPKIVHRRACKLAVRGHKSRQFRTPVIVLRTFAGEEISGIERSGGPSRTNAWIAGIHDSCV